MGRGPSNRLVVELELDLKRELYVALSQDQLTFKEWLKSQAQQYIATQRQPALFTAEPVAPSYKVSDSASPPNTAPQRTKHANGRTGSKRAK